MSKYCRRNHAHAITGPLEYGRTRILVSSPVLICPRHRLEAITPVNPVQICGEFRTRREITGSIMIQNATEIGVRLEHGHDQVLELSIR